MTYMNSFKPKPEITEVVVIINKQLNPNSSKNFDNKRKQKQSIKNIVDILRRQTDSQISNQDSKVLQDYVQQCFERECIQYDQKLLQFFSSNLKLQSLPENTTFNIQDEDDFLILIYGEVIGVNRQIKFQPGSIFGGNSLVRMIIKEKSFKCLDVCIFGIVEIQQLNEYQLLLSQVALTNKTTQLLSQCRYFSQWNSDQIQQIIQNSNRIFFKQNQWVYQEGQQSTSVYFILSGKFSKCLDLSEGDVVGDEDDLNQERFYGVRCKSENGYMLRIDIQKFIQISEQQQLTKDQVLKRKKVTHRRYQYYEKVQQNEMLKQQGTLNQIGCQKQKSGQGTPLENSTFNSLNNSQTENTMLPSNRSNQKLKNNFQILQSRNNSQENILIEMIKKSKENSNEEEFNPNNMSHDDNSYDNANRFISKQSSIDLNSPKKIQKSSSQTNISSQQLKCIPISFRIDYIQARKKLERKIGDFKKNSKMTLPDESIKIAQSNLRAEHRDQSFEKFSEQAYKNISKEIRENYSVKFWHQMQNQIVKLATYSKKMNNDQSNQFIRQDPSSESRPLIRSIQKKILNMNQKNEINRTLENSGYIKRFNSTQDLSSPQKRSISNQNSQPSYQNFIQQKSFAQINNEQSSLLEQGKLEKNQPVNSKDSSPQKKIPFSFHIQQPKQKNNQVHRYLVPAQTEPQCFSEAVNDDVNQNSLRISKISMEQKDGSLSPVVSPIQKSNYIKSRSSLGDINQRRSRSPAYMSPILNTLNNSTNTFKDHAQPRKSLINLHQMPKKQDNQIEKELPKEQLEQSKIIQEHQSKNEQRNQFQNPVLYSILQKRKTAQQSVQPDLSVSKSNHITPTCSPQKLQAQILQKQQYFTIQPSEKPRQVYSPIKRHQKSNSNQQQLQLCDFSQVSKVYQMEKEDKISQVLQNKMINSNAQTFQKLKSLNAIIKKKEV